MGNRKLHKLEEKLNEAPRNAVPSKSAAISSSDAQLLSSRRKKCSLWTLGGLLINLRTLTVTSLPGLRYMCAVMLSPDLISS